MICYLSKEKGISPRVQIITDIRRLHFPDIRGEKSVSIKKGRESFRLLPLYMGFDIETTSGADERCAYMYTAAFCVASVRECCLYLFRRWDEVVYFLEEFSDHYNLNSRTKVLCGVANLNYEFNFVKKLFPIDPENSFAKGSQSVLYFESWNIRFMDVLPITGGNLAYLAKSFCTTQKLVGDLDYKKKRNSLTPLTDAELGYIYNDVIIISEFMFYLFDQYIRPGRYIPMTKTGLLRRKNLKHGQASLPDLWDTYKALIRTAFPTMNDYFLWFQYLFRGGFVHANLYHVNELMYNVDSYDRVSAYPAEMLINDGFPMTPFLREDPALWEERIVTHCCILDCIFYDLKQSTNHSIESFSKVKDFAGVDLDNGRIRSADMLHVMLTEQDFLNYKDFYTWEKLEVLSLKTAERGRLPKFLLDVLADSYRGKTELKRAGKKDTPEYTIKKEEVNSNYGMLVTRIRKEIYKFDESEHDFVINECEFDYEKEVKKAFLLPQWGIWVCAFQRRNLLKLFRLIEDIQPNLTAYGDTDSCKCEHDERITAVVDEYNKAIREKRIAAGWTDEVFNGLGEYEHEATYTRFKTLGAKRYLSEEKGEIHATIAGFKKSKIDALGSSADEVFRRFDKYGFKLTPEESGKQTCFYQPNRREEIITDEFGNSEMMVSESSACIYDIPFSLTIKGAFLGLIEEVERKGLA